MPRTPTKGSATVSMPFRKSRLLAQVAAATVLLGALSACSSSEGGTKGGSGALKDGFGDRAKDRNVEFITYYDPSQDAFWNQIKQGAEDAAELGRFKLKQGTAAGDTGRMTDLINAAVASKPAALVISFNDPAWENAACEASKSGIPVFAYNVPPTGPAKDCIKAFVGQDFYQVGTYVGQKLVDSVDLSAGDKVLCPAEEPSQQYAIQRGWWRRVGAEDQGRRVHPPADFG